MRSTKYLNSVLTVIAVLLAALLWTNLADRPLFSQEASAQVRSKPRGQTPIPTIPNAASQRDEMLRSLKDIRDSIESQNSLLNSGGLRVRVTNLNEIKLPKD